MIVNIVLFLHTCIIYMHIFTYIYSRYTTMHYMSCIHISKVVNTMLFISAIPFNMAYAYDMLQLIECNRSDSVYHPKLDLRNLLEPAIML